MKPPRARVSIPHVSWRDGRPRFNPGPKVRALGFEGEDLRHGRGAWYTLAEATAWVAARMEEIEARRQAKRAGVRAKPVRKPGQYMVEDLFRDWFASPRLSGADQVDGRRTQKALAANTVKDYRYKANTLAAHDGELWVSPVAALDAPACYGLYEDLWSRRGLSTARGVMATLSAAISWGLKRGKIRGMTVNPAKGLGMQTPAPRVHAVTPAGVTHWVATADAMGRPEIGDSIMLGVWSGQRQNDRLGLIDLGLFDGRRRFQQSKTGAVVEIPEAPQLAARLAAARERRKGWKVHPTQVLVDEKTRRPWKADWYRHVFAEIRDAAVKSMPDLVDDVTGAPRDQDLRDTAVTWLARAGCTVPQIASITGHNEGTITAILKHYLSHHRELADKAIAQVVAWHEGQTEVAK